METTIETILVRTWSDKCRQCSTISSNITKKGIVIHKPFHTTFLCNHHFLMRDMEDIIINQDLAEKLSIWFSKDEIEEAILRIQNNSKNPKIIPRIQNNSKKGV